MLKKEPIIYTDPLRLAINALYRAEEKSLVQDLIEQASLEPSQKSAIADNAKNLVEKLRKANLKKAGLDSFLSEYALSTEEGVALMCLAEALLRIPDQATRDLLIQDKLGKRKWKDHRGQSDSFFVNAATWALILTGQVLIPEKTESEYNYTLKRLLNSARSTFVRKAVEKAMKIISRQFIMGSSIQDAISRARKKEAAGYRYSYDMLGEAALRAHDAEAYFNAYEEAIEAIGTSSSDKLNLYQRAGISIKLSALHPRYEEAQQERVLIELTPKVLALAQLAKHHNLALTIDAEEAERLDLSLDLIERVFSDESLKGWEGFGVAVQSYQKRALPLLDWLINLAKINKKRLMIRLIKGAYWDSEIKRTQMLGLKEYPVFTRKAFTDVSFQACAKKIVENTEFLYPQFATHNAYSVAMILELVGDYRDFEFQRLHGMGVSLYEQIAHLGIPCRIYAPVGQHDNLLPYLIRRILENGANSSFVNRIADAKTPIHLLIEDPLEKAEQDLETLHQRIPLPENIMPLRKNSIGFDLSDRQAIAHLHQQMKSIDFEEWEAYPIIAGKEQGKLDQELYSPQQNNLLIGHGRTTRPEELEYALEQAQEGFKLFSQMPVEERCTIIERFAEALEKERTTLFAMLCLEAGKTWSDAVAEVREAVDFCRYYALKAKELMGNPLNLEGYTGESNALSLHPRGLILCISPWNFPLAIFTGQIIAALVTGNAVLAKPAEQTPILATFVVNLLHQVGLPPQVLQLLPGDGEVLGDILLKDPRIKGVLFTGSIETAKIINRNLAHREGEIIPFIAETGGQNAMIVDSSALLEQVVLDVMHSAFGSAGQRCSALRVLYIQEDIYTPTLELLKGAMAELRVGDPSFLNIDVGPVIDPEALSHLQEHVKAVENIGEIIYQYPLPKACESGFFMPPTVIAINAIGLLKREVFGPILHLIPYKYSQLDEVINQINQTHYGLTLGIHSRINETVQRIQEALHVGNCYVNRNMIGAVVGLQPFGGEGLSGTGPKAGGPHYLIRLCHERVLTVNTTAAGGNASLVTMSE